MLTKALNKPQYEYEIISSSPTKKTKPPARSNTSYTMPKQTPQFPTWQTNLMWALLSICLVLVLGALGLSIYNTVTAVNEHNINESTNITKNSTSTLFHNATINVTTTEYINTTFNGTYVKAIIPGNANTIVNNSDPFFPVLSFFCNATGIVQTIINGTGILVDNTNPVKPIVSTTAILTLTPGTPDVTVNNADPQNLIISVNTTIAGPCIESVSNGTGILIDKSDPANIIVSTDAVLSVEQGMQIYINNSDPQRPIISANITVPTCIQSVNGGLGINVNNADPLNLIVNNTGVIQVFGSSNIIVDNTNTQYPTISTNITTNIIQQVLQDNGTFGDPFLLSTQGGTLGLYKNQGAALHSRLVLLTQSGTIGQTVSAQTNGMVVGMSGLISGAFYYYDTSTNLLTTIPTTYFVGYAFSSTSIFFSPQPIYIP